MVMANSPRSKYLPRGLVKLIKTSAAIGLKSCQFEEDYSAPIMPCIPEGLPAGTECRSYTERWKNRTIWEAKWP